MQSKITQCKKKIKENLKNSQGIKQSTEASSEIIQLLEDQRTLKAAI
jgi:hypothetical protein